MTKEKGRKVFKKAKAEGFTYYPASLDQIVKFYAKEVLRDNLLMVNYWVDTGKGMVIFELLEKGL